MFYFTFNEEKNTLANTSQARKRVRQANKARARNASQKSEFRSSVKKVLKSISEKNKDQSSLDYKNAVSVKLLAKGALKSKIKIEVSSASDKAKKAVENMGGELNLVSS